jgi:glycosyltransferase involved in cell wall biosynthesis
MCALDVLVVSSAWGEAFPNVLVEAFLSGVPAVSTDVGDAAFIIDDEKSIVPPRSPEALSDAISYAYSKSIESNGAYVGNQRDRMIERYGISSIVLQYSKIYEGCL